MSDDAIYINCRRALGVGFFDVFKKAQERKIDIGSVEEIFHSEIARDDAICALRLCGMSSTDIGNIIGLTRERVRQIITDAGIADSETKQRSGPRERHIDKDALMQLLCTSPAMWNIQGVLKKLKVIEYFTEQGYSEADVRDALETLGVDKANAKARILLTYWLNLPSDKHYDYFSDQLRRITQSQLLDGISGQKPVVLSIMAFNKYMRSIGIYSPKSGAGIRRSYGKDDDNSWEWLRATT